MFRVIALNGIVAFSLLFWGLGFMRTVLGVRVEASPFRELATVSYQAMSPFQRYDTHHTALAAEGRLADGTWEPIRLEPLFPGSDGERTLRMMLPAFLVRGEETLCAARERLRLKLSGVFPQYEEIRLWQERWPQSADGEEAMRRAPFLVRTDDCPAA